MIDDRWNYTLHHPIHDVGLYLNPAFSHSCGFRFEVEVMDGFFECVERIVEFNDDHTEISKELEVYRRVTGTFGFQMEKKEQAYHNAR